MMGPRQVAQGSLFYEFSIEDFVPQDHPMRGIDRFLDLTEVRPMLAPTYSLHGRPSIDPKLMIRMLLLGYCMGIRSERRLCEEVHVNLAYRWFCRLDLADPVPDHSTFSKNRHGRFRESGLFRHLFETVLRRCINEGLVGGHSFGVDASLIPANANQTRGVDSKEGLPPELASRAVDEYLETLNDAAFGAATKVVPKYISPPLIRQPAGLVPTAVPRILPILPTTWLIWTMPSSWTSNRQLRSDQQRRGPHGT